MEIILKDIQWEKLWIYMYTKRFDTILKTMKL